MVIKGVKIFQNNANQEYSDLDIMQMLGRAVSAQVISYTNLLILICDRAGLNSVGCTCSMLIDLTEHGVL